MKRFVLFSLISCILIFGLQQHYARPQSIVVTGCVSFNGLPPNCYIGPGDLVSGAVAWWGLRAYSAAVVGSNGKLVNVTLSTNSHTCDILAATSSGDLGNTANCSTPADNGTAAAAFCGANCTINTAYDQTGATNCTSAACNLVQTTAANQPALTFDCITGKACMTFNGTTNLLSTSAVLNANNTVPMSQAVVFSVVAFPTFAAVSISNGGSQYGGMGIENTAGNFVEIFGEGSDPGAVTDAITTGTFYSVQGIISAAAGASALVLTDSAKSGTLTPPASYTGNFFLGNDPFPDPASIKVTEAGWWAGSFTSGQYGNLCHNDYAYFGLPGSC